MKYRRGKRRIASVQTFELVRDEELLRIEADIRGGRWQHSPYRSFTVFDPKPRAITAAAVRDRVVHQVVFEEIERVFEPTFLPSSYSARPGRGVHRALDDVERAIAALRRRGVHPVWAAKGDVAKFYDSIDHRILLRLLGRRIDDPVLLRVMAAIVESAHSRFGCEKGIPIGNITSQVFANVYLHELDRHAIHEIGCSAYFRYADDVLVLGDSAAGVDATLARLQDYCGHALALDLKVRPARKLSWGIDFLGSVLWPYGRTLRRQTRRRVIARLQERERHAATGAISAEGLTHTEASYRGVAMRVRDRELNRRLAPG